MDKDTYVLSFMGRSTIGKSRIISTCIQDSEISSHMHKDNISGKTKTNIVYIINCDKQNSLKLVPKINDICNKFLSDSQDKIKFQEQEFKKVFSPISRAEDFEGIEKFADEVEDIDELKIWLNEYIKKIERHILEIVLEKKFNNTKDQIVFYCNWFEENLIYNKLFDVEIELKASEKFKKILEQYQLKRIILIDTRGVFDAPDKLQRSFTHYNPDVNIFIFDEKGMTEHLFNEIYNELKPMFGKSFEICIRTTTPLNAPLLTIDNCISPTKNESLAKKFANSIKFLEEKNVLEGNTVFDIRLREQLGSVLPEIPNKDDYGLTEHEVEAYNDKYDDIICKLFDKVIGLKQQEEAAITSIRQKCKNPSYKKSLINSIIYGKQNVIWLKYAKRCLSAVNGDGSHLSPKPQAGTIQWHIEKLFFDNDTTNWGKEQYVCNIVTYEAANLINDAIESIRKDRESFSDEELSEYIFILKNTLAACQNSLSEWTSYVFFSNTGCTKSRIPSWYYYAACKDTVAFSKGGSTYYTIYDKINAGSTTKTYKSALLNCIIKAVSSLLEEKLEIEKIILTDTDIAEEL